MKLKIMVGLVAALLVVGGIAFGAVRYLSPARDGAVELVPARAVAYANVFLDPSMRQKLALKRLLDHFPNQVAGIDKARRQIEKLLDRKLRLTGLSFRNDVEPWLGDEVALWYSKLPSRSTGSSPAASRSSAPGTGALLVSTTDAGAAMDAVRAAERNEGGPVSHGSYRGVDYDIVGRDETAVGSIGDFLVLGTRAGFRASVDARRGTTRSLDASERYRDALGGLAPDRLALVYLDGKALAEQMPASLPGGVAGSFVGGGGGPTAAVLYARSSGLVIDAKGPAVSDRDFEASARLLRRSPSGAWLAAADPGFGTRLRALYAKMTESLGLGGALLDRRFEQQTGLELRRDLLSWMGSLRFFVEGRTRAAVQAGAAISTDDPAAAARAVRRLGSSTAAPGVPLRPSEGASGAGPAIAEPGMPRPLLAGVLRGEVDVAYGRRAWAGLTGAGPSIARDRAFRDAEAGLGEGYAPTAFVNVGELVSLIESGGRLSDERSYRENVKPFLGPLEYAVMGSKHSGNEVTTRFVIGVR